MRNLSITLGAMLLCLSINAQNTGRITGAVLDASNKHPLEGATISVLNHQSGIFINHSVSGKKGSFQITGLPLNDSVEVIISFTGYRDTSSVQLLRDKLKHTGDWMMHAGANELDSVVVTAHRPPFIVKKDTVEFDAKAFKSLPADMLEDLLRKLPGMVMDGEGNVTMNGKKVNKIKVDGRDFFGGNLQTALQNLPGSAIDKVQVYDTREIGTEHNSIIKPVTDQVTLNVTLKKQKSRPMFGHTGVAGGTSGRYNADLFANTFDGDKNQGISARTGNAPSGHSMREDMMMGMAGGGAGILKNNTDAALNFARQVFRNGKLNASVGTRNSNQLTETQTDRTNILPDSTFMYNNMARTNSVVHANSLNLNYDNSIDTLQRLSVNTMASFSNNTTHSVNNARSYAETTINTQDNTTSAHDRTLDLSNRINYSRTSRDKKTNLSLTWELGWNHSKGDQVNNSINKYYTDSARTVSLDQNGLTSGNGINNNLMLNLARELDKHFSVIFNYAFAQSLNNTGRDTYNYDASTGKHDLLDSLYSVHNRNTNISHLPSASIGYKVEKWSFELGAGLRHITQINTIVWKDSIIKLVQNSLTPRLSVAKNFGKGSMWIMNYSMSANQPTPDQLAPVQDNTNPLYIKVGNPHLKSSLTHNVQTQLMSFSRDYKWRVMIMGNSMFSTNQIVNNTYYDSLGRQITTFVNTSGNRSGSLTFNLGSRFQLGKWSLDVQAGSSLSNSRSTGFTNLQENISKTVSFTPNLNLALNYRQYLSVFANAGIDIHSTKYSLAGINGIDYNTKRLLFAVRTSPVRRLIINTSMNYFFNSQLPDGFQKSRAMLNASVNYNLLKTEKLSVGLAVVDLLNSNVNLSRTVSPTAIETTQSNMLRRYAMFNLAYRFNSFGR